MTDHKHPLGDVQQLQKRLSELHIIVSENQDGGFTAASQCEPYFCFERETVAELARLVESTLTSYVHTFYNVESVEVRAQVESEPIERKVPVERSKPVSRLRPSFGNLLPNQPEFVMA